MSKRKKLEMDKLFTRYARNLSIYRPEYNDKFLCPICLKKFDRCELDRLVWAHIFPEKLGGRLHTLSCAKCDNSIGHEFNRHAVAERKMRIWEKGPKYGRFIPENGQAIPIMSMWNFEKSTISIYPPSKNIPIEKWICWIDEIRGRSKEGGPYKFSIELKEPEFVPTRRDISHIHSAFLMMFHQFGYEYILSPNVDKIRQMFNGSDLSWKPNKLVRSVKMAPESKGQHIDFPLIGILIEPEELRSFVAFLPSIDANDSASIVFLPGIGEDFFNLYKHLELDKTPNEELTAVYPSHITNNNYRIRYDIDIADSRSKGVASHLYQSFRTLKKAEIKNIKVHIHNPLKSVIISG